VAGAANGGSTTGGATGFAGDGSGGTTTTGGTTAAGSGGVAQGGSGGSGGTTTTAGTGGAVETGGTAGVAGATGTGGAGGSTLGPSAGCGMDPPIDEEYGQAVLHEIDITGMAQQYVAGYTHRKYCTRFPSDYNPATPYPVVFYGPGCGASGCEGSSFSGRDDIIYVQAIASADATGDNAVPLGAAPGCFQAGRVGTADSPEGPYFDQVMAEVASKYCIDTSKVFAAGTSSGSWLSNYLACARGGAVRGIAADSGGLQFDHGTCTGGAAIMEFPGDAANVTQDGQEIGQAAARDMFIEVNGCSTTPTQMQFGDDTCDFYGDCDSPVVWCDVGGGHQSGNNHLSPTGWAFWSTLQ
jgi:poly(3-hydroxybutyrate) depolymerase